MSLPSEVPSISIKLLNLLASFNCMWKTQIVSQEINLLLLSQKLGTESRKELQDRTFPRERLGSTEPLQVCLLKVGCPVQRSDATHLVMLCFAAVAARLVFPWGAAGGLRGSWQSLLWEGCVG